MNLSSRKKIFHHNEGNSSSWAKTDLSSVGGLSQMLQELGVDKSQWSDIAKRMANNMPGDDNPNGFVILLILDARITKITMDY